MPNVSVIFFDSDVALRQHAQDSGNVWAGLSFATDAHGSLNASGLWNYTLSFNVSAVSSTGSGLTPGELHLFDQFNSGLADYFFQYYASGFLSLQTALSTLILDGAGGTPQPVPWPYGVPFPIAAYEHDAFFDFAGNLIGLVTSPSDLVPACSPTCADCSPGHTYKLRPRASQTATMCIPGCNHVHPRYSSSPSWCRSASCSRRSSTSGRRGCASCC